MCVCVCERERERECVCVCVCVCVCMYPPPCPFSHVPTRHCRYTHTVVSLSLTEAEGLECYSCHYENNMAVCTEARVTCQWGETCFNVVYRRPLLGIVYSKVSTCLDRLCPTWSTDGLSSVSSTPRLVPVWIDYVQRGLQTVSPGYRLFQG